MLLAYPIWAHVTCLQGSLQLCSHALEGALFKHTCMAEALTVHCIDNRLNALQVAYPQLHFDEREALEAIIRGCLADFEHRWDAYSIMDALSAFMSSKNWLQ